MKTYTQLKLIALIQTVCGLIISMNQIAWATSNPETDLSIATQGIEALYSQESCGSQCLDSEKLQKLAKKAADFKSRFDQIILPSAEGLQPDSKVTFTVDKKNEKRIHFSFPSLIQKSNPSAWNTVQGDIFLPQEFSSCQGKWPATVILHRIINEFKTESMVAELASIQSRGIAVMLYLPNYGPRFDSAQGPLINTNIENVEENILQALGDIHQTHQMLASLPYVNSQDIGLTGFSLGGIFTLMSAGIDPVFDRYLTIVGGGDLAYTLSYKYRHPEDKSSFTAKALTALSWKTDEAREMFSKFDAFTWANNIRGKKITMINSIQDDLLDIDQSVRKLFSIYKSSNPQSQLITYDGGGHVVDLMKVGLTKSFTQIISPLAHFFRGEGTYNQLTCQEIAK